MEHAIIREFNNKDKAIGFLYKLFKTYSFDSVKLEDKKDKWIVECIGEEESLKILSEEIKMIDLIEESLIKIFDHRNDIVIDKNISVFGSSIEIETTNKVRISSIGYGVNNNRISFNLYSMAYPKDILEALRLKIQFNFKSFLGPDNDDQGYYYDLKNIEELIFVFDELKPFALF